MEGDENNLNGLNDLPSSNEPGDSVQARLEANERARQILESQRKEAAAAKEQTEKGETVKTEVGNDAVKGGEVQAGKKDADAGKDAVAKPAVRKNKTTTHEAPAMAGVNLVVKKNALARSFKKNKKVWLGAGAAAVAVLVLVIVGVVISVNGGKRGDDGSREIGLNYNLEGYGEGETPADSAIAVVFSNDIVSKMQSDNEYTYGDAMADYEEAYAESGGDLQVEVTYQYAYFIYNNTKDVNSALAILRRVEGELDNIGMIGYYSTIANLYSLAGETLLAEQYTALARDYASKYANTDDEEDYLMQEIIVE